MGQEMNLVPLVPTTPMDFETMRQIRNQCREFLTRDTAEISPEQQQRWSQDPQTGIGATLFPFLYLRPPTTYVGYGIRRLQVAAGERRYWLTGCVVEDQRGKGYGEQIFRHLCEPAGDHVYLLEVRISNLPARRLYEKLGFVEHMRLEDILVLRRAS